MMTAILLAAFIGVAQAEEALIKDNHGNVILTVQSNGEVRDRHGFIQGTIKDGWFLDKHGFRLYEIVVDEKE